MGLDEILGLSGRRAFHTGGDHMVGIEGLDIGSCIVNPL